MINSIEAAFQKNKKQLGRYIRAKFRADLVAGLTVAMVVIPQGMAYATIAGVNPIYGLFTAIVPTIVAALFGSFPYLITGPSNPMALVTASTLLIYATRPDYFEFVVALAVIAGVFNIIFGFLKLGSLARYISNSVLVGFLTAVGVLIVSYQLGNLFGFSLPPEGGVWGIIRKFLTSFTEMNVFTLIVSAASVGLMVLIRKINRKLPAALITIIFAALLVFVTGWSGDQDVRLVTDYGLPDEIGFGFHIPQVSWGEFASLGVSGAAIALLGFMETISIAKSMSQMTGEPVDPSREMIGQGLGSLVGGFFQCIPSSGSPTRTAINVVNGAKTRYAAVISGISVLSFLLVFSGLIGYIPISSLAAIVIVSAAGLVNISLIKMTWQTSLKSRIVMGVTFVATLVLPLEYAIYLGVLTTILFYLGESGRMNLSYIIEDKAGHFIELPLKQIQEQKPPIAIVNIEGDLYFAAVEDLQTHIEKLLQTDLKVLILRFRRTHLLGSTGVMALEQLLQTARNSDVEIIFCGLKDDVLRPLEDAGVTSIIGEENIFTAGHHLFESTQRALNEAKLILENQKTPDETAVKSAVDTGSEEKSGDEPETTG